MHMETGGIKVGEFSTIVTAILFMLQQYTLMFMEQSTLEVMGEFAYVQEACLLVLKLHHLLHCVLLEEQVLTLL